MVVSTRSSGKTKTREPLLTLRQCVFLISCVNILGKLADVLIIILGQMPTVLLLLNANDVNLTIASAANVPFYSFILIGVVRRVIEDCLYFFSGRWYGKDIVAYLTKENRCEKLHQLAIYLFSKITLQILFL